MSERLREAPEQLQSKERAISSPELHEQVEKIAQGVELLQEVQPGEVIAGRAGEQWSQSTGGSTGGTQAASVPVDTRIPLPKTIEGIQQLVRTEIQSEMKQLLRTVSKEATRGKLSAHEMNELAGRLRRLKGFLRNLLSFSREKLKELLFMFVPASKFIDEDEQKGM